MPTKLLVEANLVPAAIIAAASSITNQHGIGPEPGWYIELAT
jgi:hypothetical protein